MKNKTILASLSVCLMFIACDDTITRVGLGIQPEGDKISVYDDTIYISASTIKTDSVYAKSIVGYLGEYYDPDYGSIKAGYASQFYPAIGFKTDSLETGKIDSIRLNLYFKTWVGDSLAPMEVTVYPINKPLEKHYYTNINPADFCDMENPIVRTGYVAHNSIISDSLINTGLYPKAISIPLPQEMGQAFLEEAQKPEPNAFSSVENFIEYFPGFYLKSSFGTGCMLSVDYTWINIYYKRYYTYTNSSNNDTTVLISDHAQFQVTKEVMQMNTIESDYNEALMQPNKGNTFIKSPNGVFTKLSIPLDEIKEKIGDRKFSGVTLSLKAVEKNSWKYALNFPGMGIIGTTTTAAKLLLIEPDSVKNFFEKQSLANNYTSYTTTFSETTYSYTFSNISNLIQNVIDNAPEKDVLELLLIPVQTSFSLQSTSSYTSVPVDYATFYHLFPTAVTLRTEPEDLKIRLLASDLETGD